MALLKKKRNSGQALIEAVVALLLLKSVLVGGFVVIYLAWAKLWLSFHANNSHFCLAEGVSPAICKTRFIKETKAGLPWGEIDRLKMRVTPMYRGNSYYEVKFSWRILKWKIPYKKKLSYRKLLLTARRGLYWRKL